MQISTKGKKGNSLSNAIIIEAQDTITGVSEEHAYLDKLCSTLDNEIRSVEQNLIIENGRQYDKFVILLEGDTEMTLYFDITSFFGKF